MRRPRSARAVRARSTASRMSLTPAMTAESCMNSASARRAISRASVVLPVPGGPQRISECSWPLLQRLAQRLARRRAPVPGRRIHRACAAACDRPAAAAHRRVRTSRRKSGCPPGIAGCAARSHCAARRPNNHAANSGQRASPHSASSSPSAAPSGIRDHVTRIALAADMHVVLRELDRDAEHQQEHEDLPPGAPRHETGEIQRQRAVADQVAHLVVAFEGRAASR